MMASVRPKATTTAASRQARRCTRPDTAWWSGRAPAMAITIADIHSRRAVTAAGGICANNLAASPAPNWTEKMPVTTSTDGGTTVHSAHWFAGPRFHDPEGLSCVSRLSRDRAAWVLWPGGTGLLVAGTACHSSSGHAEAIDQPDPALDRRRRRRWPGCQRPARLARWIFCPAREPPRHGCGRAWTSRGRRRSARHGRRCGAGTSPWAPAPPPRRADRLLGPQPGQRRQRAAGGDIRLGARPRRDERPGAAAVPPPQGPDPHHNAAAVPAVRGRDQARPDRRRTVRRAGSLLGRMPRARQALRARGTQGPAGQDRTAPR